MLASPLAPLAPVRTESTCTHSTQAYRPLPLCPPQTPDETLPEYAARVLRYLLDHATTVMLTPEQMELADMAACRAVTTLRGPLEDPQTLDAPTARIAATVSATRHMIASALAWHRRQTAPPPRGEATPPKGGSSPGRPAPLQPPPTQRPPGGAYATPQPPRTPAADGIRF